MHPARAILVGAALWLGATASGCGASHTPVVYSVVSGPRDWTAHPAVLVMAASPVVYAVSDVHGGYDRLAALLAKNGVIAAIPRSPDAAEWKAAGATLVIAGDLIDKGPSALEAIDLVRALETRAAAAGGAVVFTLGNHEAEFFVDPGNSKADGKDGFDAELRARGIDPVAVASGAEPRGKWLRERPFGAKVGGWFFAHAGNTSGRTVPDLESALRAAHDAHDFNHDELVGPASLLEARGWYGDSQAAAANARALGAGHIVFGHDPNALGPRGAIATAESGLLFRIDCGLSPDVNDSKGAILRIRRDGASDVAESLDAEGTVLELWRGPGSGT